METTEKIGHKEVPNKASATVDTKNRILDAAESLFSQNGIEGTSLRDITSKANANLAAVNYHFQSKDVLVEAVLARRITPLNENRLEALAKLRQTYGPKPIPVEKIIQAFIQPILVMAHHPKAEMHTFLKIFGRCLSDPCIQVTDFIDKHFNEVFEQFAGEFMRALPNLPLEEIAWRMHFMIGTFLHTIYHLEELPVLSKGLCKVESAESTMAHLIRFIAPGFQSPPPAVSAKERSRRKS